MYLLYILKNCKSKVNYANKLYIIGSYTLYIIRSEKYVSI